MIWRIFRAILRKPASRTLSPQPDKFPDLKRPAAELRHPALPINVPSQKSSSRGEVPSGSPIGKILKGRAFVIDGDTIVINGTHIRVAGIDAPELDHPWGKKAKFAMIQLCKGKIVIATLDSTSSYDRVVGKCHLEDGTDLAAEMVKQGLALDWRKYSAGAYRHLEPAGIRKKLWRAAARQTGRYKPGT